MDFVLKSEEFELDLSVNIYDGEMLSPVNTTMNVTVKSCGLCADAVMNIDAYDLERFAVNLDRIYKTLTGTATIEEPYGIHMHLSFTGDGIGHIAVSGRIGKRDENGNGYALEFEHTVDQTGIEKLSKNLLKELAAYI